MNWTLFNTIEHIKEDIVFSVDLVKFAFISLVLAVAAVGIATIHLVL